MRCTKDDDPYRDATGHHVVLPSRVELALLRKDDHRWQIGGQTLGIGRVP
jgi:hypothetical protein